MPSHQFWFGVLLLWSFVALLAYTPMSWWLLAVRLKSTAVSGVAAAGGNRWQTGSMWENARRSLFATIWAYSEGNDRTLYILACNILQPLLDEYVETVRRVPVLLYILHVGTWVWDSFQKLAVINESPLARGQFREQLAQKCSHGRNSQARAWGLVFWQEFGLVTAGVFFTYKQSLSVRGGCYEQNVWFSNDICYIFL